MTASTSVAVARALERGHGRVVVPRSMMVFAMLLSASVPVRCSGNAISLSAGYGANAFIALARLMKLSQKAGRVAVELEFRTDFDLGKLEVVSPCVGS